MMTQALYNQIVLITEDYLGPASRRFVDRQIEFHLEKKPIEVTTLDILKFAEWGKVSLGLLTEDKNMVDSFEAKILALTKPGKST